MNTSAALQHALPLAVRLALRLPLALAWQHWHGRRVPGGPGQSESRSLTVTGRLARCTGTHTRTQVIKGTDTLAPATGSDCTVLHVVLLYYHWHYNATGTVPVALLVPEFNFKLLAVLRPTRHCQCSHSQPGRAGSDSKYPPSLGAASGSDSDPLHSRNQCV